MMKRTIAGLAAAALLSLTACGVSVDAGTVVDKEYKEPYTTQEEIMTEECEWDTDTKTTMVNGKSKTKTTREYECEDVGTGEFENIEHPAEYRITLEDKDGNDETHSVTEEEFESVEVGEFFDTTTE